MSTPERKLPFRKPRAADSETPLPHAPRPHGQRAGGADTPRKRPPADTSLSGGQRSEANIMAATAGDGQPPLAYHGTLLDGPTPDEYAAARNGTLLTYHQVAIMFGVQTQTVQRWKKEKFLPFVYIYGTRNPPVRLDEGATLLWGRHRGMEPAATRAEYLAMDGTPW